jgi:hypothetical protein
MTCLIVPVTEGVLQPISKSSMSVSNVSTAFSVIKPSDDDDDDADDDDDNDDDNDDIFM